MEKSRLQKAKSIVKNHALISGAAGYIPMPLVDSLGVSAVQYQMMKTLAENYGDETYSTTMAKRVLTALLTGYAGITVMRSAVSMLKVVPVAGSLIAGTSLGIAHGGLTLALGQTLIRHYEAGGTLANLDLKAAATHVANTVQLKKIEEQAPSPVAEASPA